MTHLVRTSGGPRCCGATTALTCRPAIDATRFGSVGTHWSVPISRSMYVAIHVHASSRSRSMYGQTNAAMTWLIVALCSPQQTRAAQVAGSGGAGTGDASSRLVRVHRPLGRCPWWRSPLRRRCRLHLVRSSRSKSWRRSSAATRCIANGTVPIASARFRSPSRAIPRSRCQPERESPLCASRRSSRAPVRQGRAPTGLARRSAPSECGQGVVHAPRRASAATFRPRRTKASDARPRVVVIRGLARSECPTSSSGRS